MPTVTIHQRSVTIPHYFLPCCECHLAHSFEVRTVKRGAIHVSCSLVRAQRVTMDLTQ